MTSCAGMALVLPFPPEVRYSGIGPFHMLCVPKCQYCCCCKKTVINSGGRFNPGADDKAAGPEAVIDNAPVMVQGTGKGTFMPPGGRQGRRPFRLAAVRKLEISRYSCIFAICQTGAATLKHANVFLNEP
jgi:hypothetical protein